MNQYAFVLLGLTAIVAALVAILVFALMRFASAARDASRRLREGGAETAFVAAALQEAMARLKEQERVTKARAEASERLSGEIISSMTSGLLVVGTRGEVRTLNPAGRRLLGISEKASTPSVGDLSAHAAPLVTVLHECLATRRPIVRRALEMPAAQRSSSLASHLGVSVSPIVDAAGEPHGAICLFTDLSAVADLEEQLRLRESLARLGELTAGIAHEFRNGLATIHGYARLIDPDKLPAAYRSYVEGIRNETQALGEVVNNFLNFAKPANLTLTPVDLHAVAERATDEIRNEVRSKGGEVTVKGHFPVIEGDEVLLRQAFSNLVRNAVEACADAPTPPRISIEGVVDPESAVARLTITDNGPGIDPAVHDRIFRPFFTTKPKGTGLGLALVQKIIVTHNGRVSAANNPGGGARVQVVLPLRASGVAAELQALT
ncbi:MAG: hypothetical protein HYX76_01695 [Acidobacteria bacterium]|nr:hypothetical protein [Acidobacteriota bacterium]